MSKQGGTAMHATLNEHYNAKFGCTLPIDSGFVV